MTAPERLPCPQLADDEGPTSRLDATHLTSLAGFVSVGVPVVGGVVAALPYRGLHGEPYSVVEHFASNLGEVGVSIHAAVFNASLMLGGLALAVFMLGLGLYLANRWAYAAAAVGVLAGFAGAVVGAVPLNEAHVHRLAAFVYFDCGLAAIAFFSLAILRDRQDKLSRWLVVPALLTMASVALFVALPRLLPVLEWLVLFTMLTWMGLTAANVALRSRFLLEGTDAA